MISQRLVCEMELKPRKNAGLPLPIFMNGRQIYCYRAHILRYTCEDSWGSKREYKDIFYAIDKESPNLVLGQPGLAAQRIHIDSAARTWRYGIVLDTLEALGSIKFVKFAKKYKDFYIFIISDTLSILK